MFSIEAQLCWYFITIDKFYVLVGIKYVLCLQNNEGIPRYAPQQEMSSIWAQLLSLLQNNNEGLPRYAPQQEMISIWAQLLSLYHLLR